MSKRPDLLSLPPLPRCPICDVLKAQGFRVECASGSATSRGFAVVENQGRWGVAAWIPASGGGPALSWLEWSSCTDDLCRLIDRAEREAPPAPEEPSISAHFRGRSRGVS